MMEEHGYYHPEVGYWQTIGDVNAETMDSYPGGTVEVSLCPGSGWIFNGSSWVEATPPIEEQILAIETEFERKKAALAAQYATLSLFDGEGEATAKATLQAAYTLAKSEMNDAIEAILFSEL